MSTLFSNLVLTLLLGLPLVGCGKDQGALPETKMQIGPQQFNLEIAVTPHDQEVGLMRRPSLPVDHGMIFVFPDEKERGFWNHEVNFPLDLIFADSGGAIVSIKHMNAYSDLNTSSDVPAKYAIELNGGTADQLHIKVGDRLTIPQDALNPPGQGK